MNLAFPKKALLQLVFFFLSIPFSQAQFLQRGSEIPFEASFQEQGYRNLVNSRILHFNGKAYISWSVMNDSAEGYFVVYKSNGHSQIKTVDCVRYPKCTENVAISFSIVDSSIEADHNFYHIVKVDRNTTFFVSEHIVFQNSIAVLRLPESDTYAERKRFAEAKKELPFGNF